jgi:hypothetical protein
MSIPSSTASSIYDWANFVLVGALAVTVGATIVIVWMGRIKEDYSAKALAAARLETETLKEKYSWRRVPGDKYSQLVSDLNFASTVVGVSSFAEPESSSFGDDIAAALKDAGHLVARQYFTSTPTYDVVLASMSENAPKLVSAFAKAGVHLSRGEANCGRPTMPDGRSSWDESFPLIYVGLKPRPTQ